MHLFDRGRLIAVVAGTALVATTLATATVAPPAGAVTFTVDATYDAIDSDLHDGVCDDGTGSCTLRAAVMQANASSGDDLVTLSPGETYELTLGGPEPEFPAMPDTALDLDVFTGDGAISIEGNGATIDASALGDRIFEVIDIDNSDNWFDLDDLTLTGGSASSGTTFIGDLAPSGGGLLVNTGGARLTDVTITENEALGLGGGVGVVAGFLEVTNSTISHNQAATGGGIGFYGGTGTITNSTIDQNAADGGGGVSAEQVDEGIPVDGPTITGSTISGNSAGVGNGGGVRVTASGGFPTGGGLTLTDTDVTGNDAGIGGGIWSSAVPVAGGISVTDGTISNNTSVNRGGGVWARPPISITNTTVSTNTAGTDGGGLWIDASPFPVPAPSFTGVTVSDNNATQFGGGIGIASPYSVTGDATPWVISGLDITDNTALAAGGVFLFGLDVPQPPPLPITPKPLVLDEISITDNHALYDGGGLVSAQSDARIEGGIIAGNQADHNGGGVVAGGASLHLELVELSTNMAGVSGGGAYVTGAMTLAEVHLALNTASGGSGLDGGGGAFVATGGDLTVEHSVIEYNQANGGEFGGGGGIATGDGSTLSVDSSSFTANQARYGAGLALIGNTSLTNSTISNNSALVAGGGIFNVADGPDHVSVQFSTVWGNAIQGGGSDLVDINGAMTVDRSIIGLCEFNTMDPGTGPSSGGFNLVESNEHCGFDDPTDLLGVPAHLGPLSHSLGSTFRHIPLPESAAIDSIPDAQCLLAKDQLGELRPFGISCDRGAIEYVPTPSFTDVPRIHAFFAEIEWLARTGATTGYDDGTYRPGNAVTRQAFAAWLWRLAGEPIPAGPPPFSDVPPDHPFADAIAWAAEEDLTFGFPDGTFRPTNVITRQANMAFLWRLAGSPPPAGDPPFSDVPPTHPFCNAIAWAAESGLAEGFPDGTFHPGDPVTRQAAAAFLFRAERDGLLAE